MKYTKNPEYDQVRVAWQRGGHEYDPECESCGKDLEGQEVIETQSDWRCEECAEDYDPGPSYDVDAQAERRQMGLVNQ